ncbi:MAG: hypothetical protein L6R37_004772 [Teloschistes peruensis]|nr:MAG: hypothetical protein L6R37_004772 [Teloschistes peruensis]
MAAAVATLDAATWGESWGFGIYQSDSDLELLDHVAEEASIMFPKSALDCLRCPLFPANFTLRAPMDKIAVIAYLNDGIFKRLARRLKHQPNPMALILLAAVEMFLEKRNQMVEALEGYRNNGIPWHFRAKDGKAVRMSFEEMHMQSPELTNRGVMKPQSKDVISRELQMPSSEVEKSGVKKPPVKKEMEKRAIRKPPSNDMISEEEMARVEAGQ